MKRDFAIFIGFCAEVLFFMFAGAFGMIKIYLLYWILTLFGCITAYLVADLIGKNAVEKYKKEYN